ncbi:hypothetical protein SAMN05216226_12510 [Halovenus aranensis]|uniref:SSD domain-containing protein n=1 Tax=Halovenus aranensis TaxID=890420 RepID=A0A1G8ZIK9_9EURY|nr:MMPL family transporter [Halovenus aranensis]SDK14939.1 hypothetical protein SAMN05216226_12510 [Halovenus aranensis]
MDSGDAGESQRAEGIADSRSETLLTNLGEFAARRPLVVVGAVLAVVVIAAGSAAVGVQMSMGMELYIDDNSDPAQDWDEIQTDFDRGNVVFVVVESESLYDPETIAAVDRLDDAYSDLGEFNHVISLADVVRRGHGGTLPESSADTEAAVDSVARDSDGAAAMVDQLRPDSETTVLMLSYGTADVPSEYDQLLGFLPGTEADVITDRLDDRTETVSLPPETEVTVTGSPVFEEAAFGLMLPEMLKLFALAFGVIFAVVFLVMRGRLTRSFRVFLPVGTALLALVYMVGAMGVLGYQFNAIMLGVMPIALGLGIDYGLQVQTRYVEERRNGHEPVAAAGITARTTGRVLFLAMGTTVVGLGALLASPVPPVRQFGVTASVSVVAAMVLSLTFLLSVLVWLDDGEATGNDSSGDPGSTGYASAEDADASGVIETAAGVLATAITARPLLVVLIVVAGVAGGATAYPQVDTTQEMLDYWPDIQEKEDIEELQAVADSPKVMYTIVETEAPYSAETLGDVATFQSRMTDHPDVNAAMSPAVALEMSHGGEIPDDADTIRATLEEAETDSLLPLTERASHPDRLLVTFYLDEVEGEQTRALIEDTETTAAKTLPEGTRAAVTGKPVLNRNVIENVTEGLSTMTFLSFSLAVVFLALALRSVRQSLLLVLSVAGSAVLLVAGGMTLFGVPWNPLTVATASIVLGVGVDYGLHVHQRFREERTVHGADPATAIHTAMATLSRPVLGSGLTTMLGFGVLTVSGFPVLSNFGKAILMAMGFALIMTFTLLPAVSTLYARVGNGRCS